MARRFQHIPTDYLRDLLRSRLPDGCSPTLLGKGRYATGVRKRPRAPQRDSVKARWCPIAKNILTLVEQQACTDLPMLFDRATFALLPKSYRKLKRLVGHHLPVFTAVFHHSSRLLLTGSDDHLVKIWSTETGYLQHTLRGHDSDITEIVKHPTRPIVVSASSDTTLRVWDVDTGAALHVLDGGSKEVNAVQFSPCPDRPYLVSGGADGSVRLWNADDFEAGCIRIPIPERTPNSRYVAAMSSDTRHAAGSSAAVATSRTAPPSPIADNLPPAPHSGLLTMNELLASAPTQPPSADAGTAAAPSGQAHAITSTISRQPIEQSVGRYPTANSMVANSMVSGAHPSLGILSVGFNAGATRLAVGGTDSSVYLYAVEREEEAYSPFPHIRHLATLRGHSDHIIQVLFSRSGDSIVTACRDGTARIWNRTKARLPLGKQGKQSVAGMGKWSSMILDCRSQIQADARSVLSGAASGSACGSIVPRMRRTIFPVSVDATMWSLTDKYVFTASSDAKIRMWDSETGKLVRLLEAHEREVYVMDCHPTDQRILLSAGYDGKCILWDIETGRQLRSFWVGDEPADDPLDQSASFGSSKRPNVTDGQFSSDGLSFALSDTSGAITIFGVESVEATALAPEEQFFSRDYAPFRRDAQNRAIDEETGLLLHRVAKGRLCDKDLRPHPPELQPNLPLAIPPKERANTEDSSGDVIKKAPPSPNAVENKNRDALMLRAKEFRENQEKEERRLLREAREARRRMIIEKEKAELERDVMPTTLQLRDFAVQDSEYDDSDEDFDGEMQPEPSDSSSTSSDEEDEVRPVARSRLRSGRKMTSSSEGEDRIRPSRMSRGRKTSDKHRPLRRLVQRGIEKRRRVSLRIRHVASDLSAQLGESEIDAGEESPGYEIGSQDGESENTGTSSERAERRGSSGHCQLKGQRKQARKDSDPSAAEALSGAGVGAGNLAAKLCPSCPAPGQVPAPRLAGASISDGRRRMKINIWGRFSAGPRSARLQSNSGRGNDVPRAAPETRPQRNDTTMTQGNDIANSVGSYEGRGQASEAGGFMGLHTPRNPSFTSERIERKSIKNTVERSSKAVEDDQGDTASFVRPRRRRHKLEDGSALAPTQPDTAQQHSSAKQSRVHSELKSDFVNTVNEVSNVLKGEGNEKSLLSDSPARLTRKRLRSRTRNGVHSAADADAVTPVVDIDDLAERELEMLEAEGSRRHTRKRRKRASLEYSDVERSTDEDGEGKGNMFDRDEAMDLPRMTMRKRGGRGNALISNEKSGTETTEGASTLSASAWLRSSSNRYTYVPQLGDDVMYFPEGHATAINISRAAGFGPLAGHAALKKSGKEILDGTSFPDDAIPVRFQIVDVSYEFPFLSQSQKPRSLGSRAKAARSAQAEDPRTAKTIAVLTLRMISGMRRRVGQNDRFVISYYPVDAPEYLVLTSRVEAALSRSWKATDRFRILFLNERRAWQYYVGTIRNVKPSMRSVMWNTVEVEYDNEGEKEKTVCEFVSPWELEAYDMLQGGKESPIQNFHSFRSSTVEPGLFPVIAREFETIREMESSWRVQLSWLDSVDALATLPGYCSKVPCPMDFDTVLVRLCTGYYRHFCSFTHDINLLKSNAIRFHGAQSEMGRLSVNIYTRLVDTAERTRALFVASLMPFSHNTGISHGAPVGHGGSRAIRPRPTQSDITAHAPPQMGMASSGRQFPVPLTPRQSGAGFAMPSQFMNDGVGLLGHPIPPSSQQRQWTGTRSYLNSGQGHTMYGGPSLGMALPPALPGVAHTAAATRGSRASRVATRGHPMRQNNSGQSRRGNVGPTTRGNLSSAPPMGIGSVPLPSGIFSHNSSVQYVPQHVGPVGQQQSGQETMVANSNQTNDANRKDGRKLAPSSSLSNPRGIMKPSQYVGASHGPPNGRIAEPGVVANARGHGSSGVVSPTQEGGVGLIGGSLSMIQPLSHGQGAILRHHNRGVSTVGDGGTHSWGRSMEGAGGIFPLQASTSESHLPQVQTGRSPSPTSPSRGDVGSRAARQQTVSIRQQTVTRVTAGTAPYHEHSTISVAAAESTMSCGGADVAMQAATAESAEVVATERSADARRG